MEDIHKKVVLQIRKEFVLLKKGWAQLKNYLGEKNRRSYYIPFSKINFRWI